MTSILDVLEKTIRPVIFVPLLIIEIITATAITTLVSQIANVSGGATLPDLLFGYDAATLSIMFTVYGEVGMNFMQHVQIIDIYHPLLYSILGASVIYALMRGTRFAWIAVIVFIGGLFDYAENFLLWIMMPAAPQVDETIAGLASAMNMIKHVSLQVAGGVLLIAVISWIYRLVRRRASTA